MTAAEGKFFVGQIVEHKRFGYRGVVYDVDPSFMLSERWYDTVALSRPPKNQPWYHVLVDESEQVTYVAERNLRASQARPGPVRHPLIYTHFERFSGGKYEVLLRPN